MLGIMNKNDFEKAILPGGNLNDLEFIQMPPGDLSKFPNYSMFVVYGNLITK